MDGCQVRRLFGAAALAALLVLTGCRTPVQTTAGTQTPPPAPPPSYFVYEVREGDTLVSLGRRFHVPWQEIKSDNDIARPEDMRVGRILLIRRVDGVEPPELSSPVTARPRAPARRPVAPQRLNRGRPSARFWWPTDGRLARRYGEPLRGLDEPGIGIAAAPGTEVYAVASGTVVTCVRGDASRAGWGNVVAVRHAGNFVSWYGCLGTVLVSEGQRVGQGEPIGTVGACGGSAGLAFRLFLNDRPVDPLRYLP